MSFSGEQARSFFLPLLGKTSTFLFEGRSANLAFARMAMALMARAGTVCSVLDLDAFYSSNAEQIMGRLAIPYAQSVKIQVPDPGSVIEEELSRAAASEAEVIVIDSLNTLYHLLSLDDGSSRSRKLSFAVASLSFIARTEKKAVIFTMYRREGFGRQGAARSISSLSDVTASAEVRGQELHFRSERGSVWPRNRFSIRTP